MIGYLFDNPMPGIPPPGQPLAPCSECSHPMCIELHKWAALTCHLCKLPIGYGNRFWLRTGKMMFAWHADCGDQDANPIPTPPPDHRALSVPQPFAEQIMRGERTIEFRSQLTHVRVLVYVYAMKRPRLEAFEDCDFSPDSVAYGVILGTVEIVDCKGVEGDYEWHMENPKRFEKPMNSNQMSKSGFWRAF